jgi:dTDP-4-amino-4,6-dideoxygalactose transaminase
LTKSGIGTGIHYPVPVHLQKPYRALGFKEGDFLVTEKAAAEVLSLPMYPGLGLAQQDRVVEEMAQFENAAEIPFSVQPTVKA